MTLSIGSVASRTASLTLAVFDAAAAADWVPTKPAATKAQFTGHPAEVMRGLAKGEDVAPIDVGPSSGFAFELEGRSGRAEAYRTAAAPLVLLAPPRAWWDEQHADHAAAVDALFAEALATADDADDTGELELTSGCLAAIYMWLPDVAAGRALAAALPRGGAATFGDGGGLLVELGTGRYRLARQERPAPWDETQALVAMYFVPA